MGTLLVAAGGGGDAIAAAALAALAPGGGVGIATMAWDRLLIDPLPGPRSAADFTGLERHEGWWQVTHRSRPIEPAGSTLPRLSSEIPLPIVLLDPTEGATGMHQQIRAAAAELGASHIRLVDVGGDVLGQRGDPGLRSPFADSLTAASCLNLSTVAWIAGPGLDGELTEAVVLERASGAKQLALYPEIWQPLLPILAWHPTEASALLASATLGVRGRVEIREAGLPVHLTEQSPTVLELDLRDVEKVNPLLSVLSSTDTLPEAERLAVQILGSTELDREREKASRIFQRRPLAGDILADLDAWEAEARKEGAEFVTYRRLAEAFGRTDIVTFRDILMTKYPDRASGLLWELRSP